MEGRPPGSPSYERHVGLLWAVLGGILKQQGRTVEARAALERGARGFAKENPKDGLARGDFLSLWRLQEDYEKVWAALSPSIEGAREDIYLAYDLAQVAVKLGRREQAAAIWAPWKGKYPRSDGALGL